MDASPLHFIVLVAIFGAIFFYVVYGVVRAAVRGGIKQAWRGRTDTEEIQRDL